MDKLILGLLADVLYIKGIICYDEFEGLMDIKTPSDLSDFTEKLLRDEFSPFKRGEAYVGYNK